LAGGGSEMAVGVGLGIGASGFAPVVVRSLEQGVRALRQRAEPQVARLFRIVAYDAVVQRAGVAGGGLDERRGGDLREREALLAGLVLGAAEREVQRDVARAAPHADADAADLHTAEQRSPGLPGLQHVFAQREQALG